MAYLALTTRCNMTCPHCCFSATHKGDDMEYATFLEALEFAIDNGQYVALGGGEPTMHPKFLTFVEDAAERYVAGDLELQPLIVTNGRRTKVVHRLLDMIEQRDLPIHVELSVDQWHSAIHDSVLSRFQRHEALNKRNRFSSGPAGHEWYIGVRSGADRVLSPVGRAKENQLAEAYLPWSDNCACEDMYVAPNGDIYSCGCRLHHIGSVFDTKDYSWYNLDYAHEGGAKPGDDEIDCSGIAACA